METFKCAILYHNYYSIDGIEDIRNRISLLTGHKVLLLVSLSEKLFLEGNFKNSETEKFVISTNKGKDIGGKLLLIDLVQKLYPQIPYLILLHDKRSYQKFSGNLEKEKLFEIIQPAKFSAILELMENDKSVGIVGTKSTLRNEFQPTTGTFNTTNNTLLKQLSQRYNLTPAGYQFVGGTMFWVKTSVFLGFFGKNNPVEIRGSLESGNILDGKNGTITHSWERLLCWIVTSSGFKIIGI
ncbi:hypothetical protein TH63_04835 [Rufibacter radiotolerans]|uniref:Rhamnan synthesis protein F n=1 Tax=Rufibacter radiotolerans TaxID=1379910 RepID=A0A0H4VID2_9BACT|nr:rhamnan synthesis F family protein [Rufibacter radiotolerans]AKQ45113.1 hypothetical protein TH63_04835 [Rufibacter radiotolerans]